MKITILLENTKLKDSNFSVENGLSMLIEKDSFNILFDTGGPEESVIKNAVEIGIDLSKVDAVVISHGHDDHTGGLLKFLQINDKAPVYLKKEALNPHYAKFPDGEKQISMDDKITQNYANRLKFVDKITEIAPGIFIIPQIEKKFPIPSSNQVLFEKQNENLVRDTFKHELFMVIENDNDLIVFSGCGHTGIKNIVNTTKNMFPNKKLDAVIGGFHLQAGSLNYAFAKVEEIEDMAHWLKEEVAGQIYTGHCTGERGMNIMEPILNDKLERIYTGMKIEL
ncbi:MAG: MBL fold metallo-hydrolase [Methanobacterium sp.]|uniref:MBL fold metallo-hydrolase n=1 Tax=Methanobacterium sp. TaxID=2164 RepID=UPI003D65B6C8|nr:MBL fold metallo-hydrolase [Methanobacterium sp.]